MDAFTTSDNRARGRATKPEKVGVLSEWGHNSPHDLSWALGTGCRPNTLARESGIVCLGVLPLAYEEDSKYDVTRRERTSREGKRGEAMQAAMDRSRWGRGQVPNPLGRGFMVRGEGFRAPRGGVEAVGQRVPGPLLSHFSCPRPETGQGQKQPGQPHNYP